MRYLAPPFLILVLCAALDVRAASTVSPDTVAHLSEAGAPQLALSLAARAQPASSGDRPLWLAWEGLQLDLLHRLDRPQELLQRTEALPADASPELRQRARWYAAQAAVKLERGAQARADLARLLWGAGLPPEEAREARRLVIRSYLAEHKADEAYLAMLRYQQDYQPLEKAEIARFAQSLAANGKAAETIPWFPLLDEGPLKLMVRLKAGIIGPGAATDAARTALGKSGGMGYWAVLAEAAGMQRDTALQVEARERLLNEPELPPGELFAATPDQLWQNYFAHALAAGNRNQLLLGEDAAWLALAQQQEAASPPTARALFAYLAANGKENAVRENAQVRLASSLLQQKLRLAANRLFAESPLGADYSALAPQARTLLGEAASQAREYALAARLWRGAAPPQDVPAEEWQLKLAQVFAAAGAGQDAFEAAQKILVRQEPLPPETAGKLLAVARELAAADQEKFAEQLLKSLDAQADTGLQREIRFELGFLIEKRQDYPAAAEHFLQAASLAGGKEGVFEQRARGLAAVNLARAGFAGDARAQYRLLLKEARDPARQEEIRRALDRLQP